jgi:large subunit ribosomal protein L25
MERVNLEVEARTPGRSSAARALRRDGKIPGVLYGAGREASHFAVPMTSLREALTGEAGRHAILDVKVPGEKSAVPAILKEFQLDPVRDRVTHVDLLAIRLDEPITAKATVTLVGEPQGVKLDGGVLDQPTHEIDIHGLPANLVDHVDVDVESLSIGESVKLGDIAVPEGLEFPGDPETVLATVTGASPVEAPEHEAAAEEGEGEEGAAEGETEGEASSEESAGE